MRRPLLSCLEAKFFLKKPTECNLRANIKGTGEPGVAQILHEKLLIEVLIFLLEFWSLTAVKNSLNETSPRFLR